MKLCYLRPHIFLAISSRYVVILDLHKDRYSCVPRSRFEQLSPYLGGWPATSRPDCPAPRSTPGDTEPLIREYIERGILTYDPRDSKPVQPTAAAVAAAQSRHHTRSPIRTTLTSSPLFFLACRRASLALRSKSLESIVRAIEARTPARRCVFTSASLAKAIRLTAAFDSLRPVYPRPYLCTFDSLALLEFLAYHRLCPQWVFGVRAEPFQAHCWVQYGGVLLNDSARRTSTFTPIMAV